MKPFLGKGQYEPKWKQKRWRKKREPGQKKKKKEKKKGDFMSKLNSLQVTEFVGFVPTF